MTLYRFSNKGINISIAKSLRIGACLLFFSALSQPAFAQNMQFDDPAGGVDDPFGFDEALTQDKSVNELEDSFRREAFNKALNTILPLKPHEIRTLLEHYDRTVESTELPVHPYPRPELVVQNISLDPGVVPRVVKLAYGYVTTLSILDATGKPWPIEDISWVGDFLIHESKVTETTHMLRVSPETQFAHGNLSMQLMGLDAPVILTFETNKDLVHYRFDAIIPKIGPSGDVSIIGSGRGGNGLTIKSGDADMSMALGGVLPRDAKVLDVSGVDGRTSAFFYNGLTYVRTPLTLLSPGWDSSVASSDGTRIYALEETPVLLLSDGGRMVRAHLSEREDLLDE